jgi:hypothetical protein
MHAMAKASKLGPKWVPMIEAARMVVRLDQALRRFQTNHEVIFALIEAARTGRVTARGTCFTTQKPKKISPRDWQEGHADWGRFALYEPSSRLPRFTHIEFEAAGIEREFGLHDHEVNKERGGRTPRLNFEDLLCSFNKESETRGPPDEDGPAGWQTQADVERWVMFWASEKRTPIAEVTARRYARRLLLQPKVQN